MKNVFVLTNYTRDVDFSVTKRIASELIRIGCNVALLREVFEKCTIEKTIVIGDAFGLTDTDLMVVIGGDGSILDASHDAIENNIPVLGINVGRLGYLSGMDISDIDSLDYISQNLLSERALMTLSVKIIRGNETIRIDRSAVNEAVVSHGSLSRLSDIEVSCEGNGRIDYRADGVIVSTPAGSTAYSLSAGGPIVESTLDLLCITPICPHSFFARSIIVSPDSTIRIRCKNDDKTTMFLTVDGRENIKLASGDVVEIARSEKKFRLISINDQSLLGVLKAKMKMN